MDIYAHRGWHGEGAPQNSMAAFRRAGAAGYGVETDLRTDVGGRIVLVHDRVIGDAPVDTLAHAELERRTGHAVPTLDDLLDADLGVPLNLEVKTRAAWAAMAPYLGAGLPAGALVSSFLHPVAVAAAERGSEAAYLMASMPSRLPEPHPRLTTIVWDFNIVDRDLLASTATAGFRSIVYGALIRSEHDWLAAAGCAAVITDHPDRAAAR